MYRREKALVQHYDMALEYWSPLKDYGLREIAGVVGAEISAPLLDLGCGDGRLANHVPFSVVGVDVSQNRIEIAEKKNPGSEWYCADLYDWLAACSQKFQVIVAIDVLEHLEEPKIALELAKACLLEDGFILGTVPLNLPYKAHLHVYKSADDVECLEPSMVSSTGKILVCKWLVS